jgi:hypothetical protein
MMPDMGTSSGVEYAVAYCGGNESSRFTKVMNIINAKAR